MYILNRMFVDYENDILGAYKSTRKYTTFLDALYESKYYNKNKLKEHKEHKTSTLKTWKKEYKKCKTIKNIETPLKDIETALGVKFNVYDRKNYKLIHESDSKAAYVPCLLKKDNTSYKPLVLGNFKVRGGTVMMHPKVVQPKVVGGEPKVVHGVPNQTGDVEKPQSSLQTDHHYIPSVRAHSAAKIAQNQNRWLPTPSQQSIINNCKKIENKWSYTTLSAMTPNNKITIDEALSELEKLIMPKQHELLFIENVIKHTNVYYNNILSKDNITEHISKIEEHISKNIDSKFGIKFDPKDLEDFEINVIALYAKIKKSKLFDVFIMFRTTEPDLEKNSGGGKKKADAKADATKAVATIATNEKSSDKFTRKTKFFILFAFFVSFLLNHLVHYTGFDIIMKYFNNNKYKNFEQQPQYFGLPILENMVGVPIRGLHYENETILSRFFTSSKASFEFKREKDGNVITKISYRNININTFIEQAVLNILDPTATFNLDLTLDLTRKKIISKIDENENDLDFLLNNHISEIIRNNTNTNVDVDNTFHKTYTDMLFVKTSQCSKQSNCDQLYAKIGNAILALKRAEFAIIDANNKFKEENKWDIVTAIMEGDQRKADGITQMIQQLKEGPGALSLTNKIYDCLPDDSINHVEQQGVEQQGVQQQKNVSHRCLQILDTHFKAQIPNMEVYTTYNEFINKLFVSVSGASGVGPILINQFERIILDALSNSHLDSLQGIAINNIDGVVLVNVIQQLLSFDEKQEIPIIHTLTNFLNFFGNENLKSGIKKILIHLNSRKALLEVETGQNPMVLASKMITHGIMSGSSINSIVVDHLIGLPVDNYIESKMLEIVEILFQQIGLLWDMELPKGHQKIPLTNLKNIALLIPYYNEKFGTVKGSGKSGGKSRKVNRSKVNSGTQNKSKTTTHKHNKMKR
jgi:hypothetical protein